MLDEPLASLDRERREEVLPYLESLRDQLAIPMVYVSHDFDEVLRLATHIVLMEVGQRHRAGQHRRDEPRPAIACAHRCRTPSARSSTASCSERMRTSGMSRVRVGNGELKVQACGIAAGATVRVQLLARDIIVSTQMPQHLSVRNNLRGSHHARSRATMPTPI